jgi:hypothetical protein
LLPAQQQAAEARPRRPHCRAAGAAQTLKAVVERVGGAERSAAAPEPPPTDENSLLTDALMLAPAVDVMAMVLDAAWPLLNRQNKHAALVKLRRLCARPPAGPRRPLRPLPERASRRRRGQPRPMLSNALQLPRPRAHAPRSPRAGPPGLQRHAGGTLQPRRNERRGARSVFESGGRSRRVYEELLPPLLADLAAELPLCKTWQITTLAVAVAEVRAAGLGYRVGYTRSRAGMRAAGLGRRRCAGVRAGARRCRHARRPPRARALPVGRRLGRGRPG